MTTAQTLKQYANEDLNLLIENGDLAMTDTAYNTVVWFSFENGIFTATNKDNITMITTKRKALMRDFIMSCFIIE